MVGVVDNTPIGDDYIDGMVFTKKLASTNLTVSYPQSASNYGAGYNFLENESNFEGFNGTQIAAHRKMLTWYADCTPFVFTEITETDSVHADLRFAMSDVPTTAHAYEPWSPEGIRIGDAWFRNTGALFDSPSPGNYAWLTMLHETGHTLGLKHPHDSASGFPALPTDKDWVEWTVMSYRSFEGDNPATGYDNETFGFSATPMERDIRALQSLYGANTTIRTGATEWHINPTTGELKIDGVAVLTPGANRVLYALPWDGGGVNTLNLLDYTTNLILNLNAGMGSFLSSAQLAQLRASPLTMADANLYIYSLNAADTDSLPNRIIPGSGTNTIAGNDITTLALTGNRAQYSVTDNGGDSFTYTDTRGGTPNGITTIDSGVVLVEYADQTVTPAASANRLRLTWA